MAHINTRIALPPFMQDKLDHLRKLDDSARFTLEAEPDNAYDPNAVKILHEGTHVGYVPAKEAPGVRAMLDQGRIAGVSRRSTAAITIEVTEEE